MEAHSAYMGVGGNFNKMRLIVLLIFLSVNQILGQSLPKHRLEIKKSILDQIDTLIYYSPRLLGKTFYQFYSQGRPEGFSKNQYKWEISVIDPKVIEEYEKIILIKWTASTYIYFNSSSHLSYVIDVNCNIWVTADELHTYLKNKYGPLDERGYSTPIKVVDNKFAFIRFDILEGNIPRVIIYSAGPDGEALYFK